MKKLGLIGLAVVLALGGLGVGYAGAMGSGWPQRLIGNGGVGTGVFSWLFDDQTVSTRDPQAVPGYPKLDWTCSDNGKMQNIKQRADAKDVAYTTAVLNGADDTLTITVHNAYAGYYTEVDFKVYNAGTIPLKVEGATLTYGTDQLDVTNNTVRQTSDGVFEFRSFIYKETPCDYGAELSMGIEIHLREAGSPVLQGHEYTFTVSIAAVQEY